MDVLPSLPVAEGSTAHLYSAGLCEMGATVVIASRNKEKCGELASELRNRGHQAVGMALDLNDDTSIKNLATDVFVRFGKIDILINNAVDWQNLTPLATATREKLQDSASTNLQGKFCSARQFWNI